MEKNKIYKNRFGSSYICLEASGENAVLRNTETGWTLEAHGVHLDEDGMIEWDFSRGGYFDEEKGIS